MLGFDFTLRTQPAREFEPDDPTHAMTEKRERLVEIGGDLTRERIDQLRDRRERRFSQSEFSSRQQGRHHFYVARKLSRPGMKD